MLSDLCAIWACVPKASPEPQHCLLGDGGNFGCWGMGILFLWPGDEDKDADDDADDGEEEGDEDGANDRDNNVNEGGLARHSHVQYLLLFAG